MNIKKTFRTLILLEHFFFFFLLLSIFPAVRLWSASHKSPYSVFGALLASFRPSSDINCEWMQTPAEEYGLQEACHILSPLGRTFNLLSWETAPFQVAQLKDMHLPAFSSHTARGFKRSIWSKWHYTDCRCGIPTGIFPWPFNHWAGPRHSRCGAKAKFEVKEASHPRRFQRSWFILNV